MSSNLDQIVRAHDTARRYTSLEQRTLVLRDFDKRESSISNAVKRSGFAVSATPDDVQHEFIDILQRDSGRGIPSPGGVNISATDQQLHDSAMSSVRSIYSSYTSRWDQWDKRDHDVLQQRLQARAAAANRPHLPSPVTSSSSTTAAAQVPAPQQSSHYRPGTSFGTPLTFDQQGRTVTDFLNPLGPGHTRNGGGSGAAWSAGNTLSPRPSHVLAVEAARSKVAQQMQQQAKEAERWAGASQRPGDARRNSRASSTPASRRQ